MRRQQRARAPGAPVEPAAVALPALRAAAGRGAARGRAAPGPAAHPGHSLALVQVPYPNFPAFPTLPYHALLFLQGLMHPSALVQVCYPCER